MLPFLLAMALKELLTPLRVITPIIGKADKRSAEPLAQDAVVKELEKVSKEIDPIIVSILSHNIKDAHLREAVIYQMLAGGKRLRPALALFSARACGGKANDTLNAAAGLEILHNYTLIIDDIIDNSVIRRGKPTVWNKYGTNITQCLGIYYAAGIFRAAELSPHGQKISRIFSETMKTVSEGEVLDILMEETPKDEPYIKANRPEKISVEDYFQMVSKKTAALLEASCHVGAVCAEAGDKETQALRDFGYSIGIAFQIQDDILDMFGDEKKFNKKIGKDIQEHKRGNIVILYATSELKGERKNRLMDILHSITPSDQEITEALDIIKSTTALGKAKSLGEKFVEKAKASLNVLPDNTYRSMLNMLADFILSREK